jgi:hypothetical protein
MQMGARKGQSTHTALNTLEQIHATWEVGGIATLLSLDISGAFRISLLQSRKIT